MTRTNRKWVSLAAIAVLASTALTGYAQAESGADTSLNQYYAMKAEDPKGALSLLEAAAKRYPGDVRIQYEIALSYLDLGDKPQALKALHVAVAIAPDRADLWRQIGYVEIDLGHPQKALEAFEQAHRIEPNDQQVVMQIGYLQQELGDDKAAAESFHTTALSGDKEFADQACEAYRNTRGTPAKLLPKPWFGEVYAAPEYQSHYDVTVIPIDVRVGVTHGTDATVETYVSLRGTIDTRSDNSNLAPMVYYDNAAILSGGVSYKPYADAPFVFFAEAGAGYDLDNRPRDRLRGDFRGGAVAYKEWNMEPPCVGGSDFPFRFVADFYADAVYYTRYDHNVLIYARARPGLRFYETPTWAVDGYLVGAVNTDARNDKDNRYEELGGGFALHAYDPMRWTARAELIDDRKHQGSSYTDFRLRFEYQMRF